MTTSLGLDIGSNSVGSTWVNTNARTIAMGVSVFPAGVEERETKRGSPKGKTRREKRSQRHSIERRAERKHALRHLLTGAGLLPADPAEFERLMTCNPNPWHLRRDALTRALTPYEFGRALVHLNQRRGALGIRVKSEDEQRKEKSEEDTEGKNVKAAITHLEAEMKNRYGKVVPFGQFMADLYDERKHAVLHKNNKHYRDPIRNRHDLLVKHSEDAFYAERALIRMEFDELWKVQKSFGGELALMLTDDLKRQLDDPTEDTTWRHRGMIFGQRRTYWDTGTLGRCDLEPTDHRCSLADMYVQEFRVLETVNNIRIEERTKRSRAIGKGEREKIIHALRSQKTGSVATVRKALGLHKKAVKAFFSLNIERDPDREINTDWFYREVVHGVFTEERWQAMSDQQRDSVNRALLKLDPDNDDHKKRLQAGAKAWWELSDEAAEQLVTAWKTRPKLEKRVNLSRRAIKNLLPYLRQGLTVTEARQRFAEDQDSGATPEQRARYAFTITEQFEELLRTLVGDEEAEKLLRRRGLTKADRHYLSKHPDLLPPAPMLANPVVRKAIYEVRRHVIAYLRRFERKPDRVVIELAREAKQTTKTRNAILKGNRAREKERRAIIEQFELGTLSFNQQRAAVERVTLCRQQRNVCAYSWLDRDEGRPITDEMAARGDGLEVDHVVPRSRTDESGLGNKVLCFRETNRGKGNQTPKEWLAPERFERLQRRFAHWEKAKDKPLKRKWENLNCDAPSMEEFTASQLTDTAYAARQVGKYLRNALYGGEIEGKRRVFFTKGLYTAMLRGDWELGESNIDRQRHGSQTPSDNATREHGVTRKGKKDRSDHHHHAIDAVVIALTEPKIVEQAARDAAWQAEHKERTGSWPRRPALKLPWGTAEEFRRQVLDTVQHLVVSHRPVKRKLVGAFHEETAYGSVVGSDTLFTNRIRADALTSNHLRVPAGWDDLSAKLDDPTLPDSTRRTVRRELAALPDPPPAKSGIVRDRELRDQIRKCLRKYVLNPDKFTEADIKQLVQEGRLQMRSGVPIKRVVLLRTINDPVVISRKRWDPGTNRFVYDDDPRTRRVYIGGNNHHIEIRENPKTAWWSGEVIDMFTAARRVRIEKRDAVDRCDHDGHRFIMSLAEGETIHMRHPDTNEPGYFVVFKLNKGKRMVCFTHHWDARPSQPRKDPDGRQIPGSERDEISVVVGKLKALGLSLDQPPYKVRVSPLGEVTTLHND
ncbi:MAG: type II CRISPR RNA-guided endonuclease Cas9 [Phycisphaerae bacterium]